MTKTKEYYTKEILIEVMKGYLIQIERHGETYPTVVLDDIYVSIKYILELHDKKNP